MLAGRKDLEFLTRYVTDFGKFSDDGLTLNGAYGYRWRYSLGDDQLLPIATQLRHNPEDRRCVLQMWQGEYDLGSSSKDIPCNLMVTFQRQAGGELDMTVFCRSNDIILGAYGANAVHFSFLHEYMAVWIGCAVGTYRQVSVNWHAYAKPFEALGALPSKAFSGMFAQSQTIADPYESGLVHVVPLAGMEIADIDREIAALLLHVSTGFDLTNERDALMDQEPFFHMAYRVLKAHDRWKRRAAPERYSEALAVLATADQTADWVVAATEWVQRRQAAWQRKMDQQVEA